MSATVLPPNASVITVLKGASDRLISMPALEKSLFRASISCLTTSVPDAYSSLKLAFAPCASPSPQWPAPVPGLVQVETPPAFTVQPLSLSSLMASLASTGYGFLCQKATGDAFSGLRG